MGQPTGEPTGESTPPGNAPLIDGLGPEWNDIVSAIPKDQRAAIAPKLKERVTSYESLRPWEDFAKQGLTPDRVNTAVSLYDIIERNPREVYDTLGKHLNITPAQAREVVEGIGEEIDEGDEDDPRIQKLQQQVDTLAQIALAKQQQEQKSQMEAEAEKQIQSELAAVKKKYGDDIPEDQIIMRMAQLNMSADQAAQDYVDFVQKIQARRPAPYILGGGGSIPNKKFEPTKFSSQETRNVVAQMMQHAAQEAQQ